MKNKGPIFTRCSTKPLFFYGVGRFSAGIADKETLWVQTACESGEA